jgi:hypothetical protein
MGLGYFNGRGAAQEEDHQSPFQPIFHATSLEIPRSFPTWWKRRVYGSFRAKGVASGPDSSGPRDLNAISALCIMENLPAADIMDTAAFSS